MTRASKQSAMTLQEWAEAHRAVSGADPSGRWAIDRVPYLSALLADIQSHDGRPVTLTASAARRKTEAKLSRNAALRTLKGL